MGKASKREQRRQQAAERRRRRIRIAVTAVMILAALSLLIYLGFPSVKDSPSLFDEKLVLLEQKAFAQDSAAFSSKNFAYQNAKAEYVVFFSLCDTTQRAAVVNGAGSSLRAAWDTAAGNARAYLQDTSLEPIWVKVDIVDSMEQMATDELPTVVSGYWDEFYRKGIALDDKFSTALLEAEINGNKLIDYDQSHQLDRATINKYLKSYGRPTVAKLPEKIILFTCRGWFCDESDAVYELYGYAGEGLDYGRRVIYQPGRETYEEVILSASYWLDNEVKDDGSFVYGYYPTYDKAFTAYNILRHTVGIQPLIWAYAMTGDTALLPQIESTVAYLVNSVEYADSGAAYVVDRSNNEIKLGGNGLAIILLDLYMKTFATDEYANLCYDLGAGILELMDQEKGTFYHVLNTDFTPKEEYRTVYYDGEATYALACLYGMSHDEKWLSAARAAADHFIAADYTQYRDHWVAYAMNELTKYSPEEKYFEFGLKNAQLNLDAIYHRETSYHTYLELLMATYELYDRMITEGVEIAYLDEFDRQYFFATILRRAEHMLNGYLYPEYAMYLKNPAAITGTFCVRHDGYRLRIDDVDHFVAGYYHLWQYYDDVLAY